MNKHYRQVPVSERPHKFRKKPVVIEAIQYTGDNLKQVINFTGKHPKWDKWFASWEEYETHVKNDRNIFKILTLEGVMEACPGDFIIKGIIGEFYPCKLHVFKTTYELDFNGFKQHFAKSIEETKKDVIEENFAGLRDIVQPDCIDILEHYLDVFRLIVSEAKQPDSGDKDVEALKNRIRILEKLVEKYRPKDEAQVVLDQPTESLEQAAEKHIEEYGENDFDAPVYKLGFKDGAKWQSTQPVAAVLPELSDVEIITGLMRRHVSLSNPPNINDEAKGARWYRDQIKSRLTTVDLDKEMMEFIEFLSSYKIDDWEDRDAINLVLVDGDWWWSSDEDGDRPLTGKDLLQLYKDARGKQK